MGQKEGIPMTPKPQAKTISEVFDKLNGSSSHACYCQRSTDGGCKCALKDEYLIEATKAINAYYLAEVLDMIGDDLVHMHLIRIYDEGCQVRDITNGIKAVFRKATKERFK